MGFVYETLEDFIQRVVVKPQLFFAWAKKSVPRLIVMPGTASKLADDA